MANIIAAQKKATAKQRTRLAGSKRPTFHVRRSTWLDLFARRLYEIISTEIP